MTDRELAELVERIGIEVGLGRSETTIQTYRTVGRRLLLATGGDLSRTSVLRYLGSLVKAGRSQSYLALNVSVLRLLCRMLELGVPVGARDLPKQHAAPRRTMLSESEIRQLIHACKVGQVDAIGTAYLCAATIWGFRRLELGRLELGPEGVSVDLAKSARRRRHRIPAGLAPYLAGYAPRTAAGVALIYGRSRHDAGLAKHAQDGFHAIRRSLVVRLLAAGVDSILVGSYMHWQGQVDQAVPAMVSLYASAGQADVDALIYPRHPFLGVWLASG